jgi:hypothetical protein
MCSAVKEMTEQETARSSRGKIKPTVGGKLTRKFREEEKTVMKAKNGTKEVAKKVKKVATAVVNSATGNPTFTLGKKVDPDTVAGQPGAVYRTLRKLGGTATLEKLSASVKLETSMDKLVVLRYALRKLATAGLVKEEAARKS